MAFSQSPLPNSPFFQEIISKLVKVNHLRRLHPFLYFCLHLLVVEGVLDVDGPDWRYLKYIVNTTYVLSVILVSQLVDYEYYTRDKIDLQYDREKPVTLDIIT